MAKASSYDPVPAIVEADAVGETAALFTDIRTTLGVPVVNLIWRHLATIPDALPWAWSALKPHYESGAIASVAEALKQDIELPLGIATSSALSKPALHAAGLCVADLERIAMILRSYERSNAMNIVAVEALRRHLAGASNAAPLLVSPPPPTRPDAITGTMPHVLAPNEMTGETRDLVTALNRFGGRVDVLPTMYRHLAHWPAYLALLHVLLAPLHADGRLEILIEKTLAESRASGSRLHATFAPPAPSLSRSAESQIRTALATFTEGPLCKMIAIVAIVQAAMARADQ